MNQNERQAIAAVKAGMGINESANKYAVSAFWLGTKLKRDYIQ